jgi:hypothetical protein
MESDPTRSKPFHVNRHCVRVHSWWPERDGPCGTSRQADTLSWSAIRRDRDEAAGRGGGSDYKTIELRTHFSGSTTSVSSVKLGLLVFTLPFMREIHVRRFDNQEDDQSHHQ